MQRTDTGQDRKAIRKTPAMCTGNSRSASEIAETTHNTWRHVISVLSPVIGANGTGILLGRAVHLTSLTYPWLAMATESNNSDALLNGIKTRLAARGTDAAKEASDILCKTFIDLLGALIGESLTKRLLNNVFD